jgi:hypothetical protein
MAKGDLLRVTGLWENDARDGSQYLSGSVGALRILVFKNKYKKKNSNQPDYNLYIAPSEPKEKSVQEEAEERDKAIEDIYDDDIPF